MLKIAVLFMVLALSVASAKTYSVDIFVPMSVAGTELKAGTYSLDLNGERIVFKLGRTAVEAKVKVQAGEERHRSTQILCATENGKHTIKTIHLGGTNTSLVIE
jgi:hypothetical protein